MMKKILLMLVAVSLMAGSAMATIDFSGETWETWAGLGVVIDGDGSTYGSADQGTAGLQWSEIGAFAVNKTFSLGDIITFNLAANIGLGNNGNDWLGYMGSGFSNNTGYDFSGGYSAAGHGSIHESQLYGGGNLGAAGISLDVTYEFTSATEATLIIYETLTAATWYDGAVAVNVADITGFYVADWNTQSTMTLSNFEVVPEPMTMALLGLGGLFLRRKKR